MLLTKEQLIIFLKQAEKSHAEYELQTGKKDPNWPEWYAEFIIKKFKGKKYES